MCHRVSSEESTPNPWLYHNLATDTGVLLENAGSGQHVQNEFPNPEFSMAMLFVCSLWRL